MCTISNTYQEPCVLQWSSLPPQWSRWRQRGPRSFLSSSTRFRRHHRLRRCCSGRLFKICRSNHGFTFTINPRCSTTGPRCSFTSHRHLHHHCYRPRSRSPGSCRRRTGPRPTCTTTTCSIIITCRRTARRRATAGGAATETAKRRRGSRATIVHTSTRRRALRPRLIFLPRHRRGRHRHRLRRLLLRPLCLRCLHLRRFLDRRRPKILATTTPWSSTTWSIIRSAAAGRRSWCPRPRYRREKPSANTTRTRRGLKTARPRPETAGRKSSRTLSWQIIYCHRTSKRRRLRLGPSKSHTEDLCWSYLSHVV